MTQAQPQSVDIVGVEWPDDFIHEKSFIDITIPTTMSLFRVVLRSHVIGGACRIAMAYLTDGKRFWAYIDNGYYLRNDLDEDIRQKILDGVHYFCNNQAL